MNNELKPLFCLICAPSGNGKNHFIQNLLYNHIKTKHFQYNIVFKNVQQS